MTYTDDGNHKKQCIFNEPMECHFKA